MGPGIEKLYPGVANRPETTQGVEEKVLLRLNPPPIPRIWTLSTGGAAIVALGAGARFAYLGTQDVRNYENPTELSPGVVDGADFRKLRETGEKRIRIANASLALGGTLALSTIVMSFLTDWYDYGAQEVEWKSV